MGGSTNEPTSPSEEEEDLETPPPLTVRPRGVKDVPDVPEARADPSEALPEDRPAIPLKPRVSAPKPEEIELDVDPPEAEDEDRSDSGSTVGFSPKPKPAPELDEPPAEAAESAPPETAASGSTASSLTIRPRAVEDHEIEEIKQRAAENAKGDQALPAVSQVPLKPRAPKVDPSSEVEVLEDEAAPEGEEDDDDQLRLQDRKTGVSRLLSDTDFAQQSALLEQAERPVWEREGEQTAAHADDGSVNMLTADEEAGGYRWVSLSPADMLTESARRRRNIFRKAGLAMALVLAMAVVAIFARNAYVAMQQAEAEAAEELELDPNALTEQEVAAADEVARAWAAVSDLGAMKEMVRRPKRVFSLMDEFYGNAAPQPVELGELQRRKKLMVTSGTFIVLAYAIEDHPGFKIITVEKTEDEDYQIDWELSTYFQPTPLDEFKAAQPTTPTSFRVVATPDNYYDHIFKPEDFICYRLTYPGTGFSLFGYARRDSNAADVLFVQTAGRALSMILDLRYIEDPLRDDRVEITDVVRLDWFY